MTHARGVAWSAPADFLAECNGGMVYLECAKGGIWPIWET